jgi:hypothetical protein
MDYFEKHLPKARKKGIFRDAESRKWGIRKDSGKHQKRHLFDGFGNLSVAYGNTNKHTSRRHVRN